ncbi:MAG: hypothetical protein D6714_06090, partial [Bacteroidetes bacterium]
MGKMNDSKCFWRLPQAPLLALLPLRVSSKKGTPCRRRGASCFQTKGASEKTAPTKTINRRKQMKPV